MRAHPEQRSESATQLGTGTDSESHADHSSEDDAVDALCRAVAQAPPADLARVAAHVPAALQSALGEPPAMAPGQLPRPGDVIVDRYRIERRIGAGGMGVVFAATHIATQRPVAIKWMTVGAAHRSDAERLSAFQRFAREARAIARVRHPNVVDVLDASQDPQAPFLVMEYLQGQTLRARMAGSDPLSYEAAVALLAPVLEAVAEAHRSGVVHRDLKPDNIFLAEQPGGRIVPKVLDFGVSRLRAPDPSEVSLTHTGTVLGTPAYMPLEQLRAEGELDERTDVYSLGVLFYEMLTGRRPVEARNAADYAALLASDKPTPLSRYRRDLKGRREAAVMRALARSREDRYPDALSFLEALRATQRDQGFTRGARAWALAGLTAVLVAALVSITRLDETAPVAPQAKAHERLPAADTTAEQSTRAAGAVMRAKAETDLGPDLPADSSHEHAEPNVPFRVGHSAPARRARANFPHRDEPAPAAASEPAAPRSVGKALRLDPADFHPHVGNPAEATPRPQPAPSLALERSQF